MTSAVAGWVEHPDYSPPTSPPATVSILRISRLDCCPGSRCRDMGLPLQSSAKADGDEYAKCPQMCSQWLQAHRSGGTWQVTITVQKNGQVIATKQLHVNATGDM